MSTPARPLAVLDIDGVVADVRHRLHHVERRPKDWAAFFAAAGADPVLPDGVWLVTRLAVRHELVWLTGRPEHLRRVTERWLRGAALPSGRLLMRRAGDRRPAPLVKLDALRRLVVEGDVAVHVDDDPHVVEAVRAAGLPALLADWVPRGGVLEQVQDREGRT